METSDIATWIGEHLPETLLILGGIVALFIVVCYVKDKDSLKYKFSMFLGVIFGAIMAYEAMAFYGDWRMSTSIIIAVCAFALIIRPFRDVHFAVILALFIMVIVYIMMGDFDGYMLGNVDMSFLSEGWPRIIVAFLVGAVFYMIFNFAEALVKLFGKILNWWPLLAVLAIVCIAEAFCIYMGYGSIADYINGEEIINRIPEVELPEIPEVTLPEVPGQQ